MSNIRKFLDISTAHLTVETRQRIDDGEACVAYRHPDGYGWFVWVPEDQQYLELLPSDLKLALEYAKKHDCDFVLFDCDAEVEPDLPTYEDVP